MNSVYIAMSIDGFIADKNDGISWLDSFNEIMANDQSSYFATRYEEYYKTIDNVVLGYNTYNVISNLGVAYPYQDKPNYILTRRVFENKDNLTFLNIEEFTKLNLAGKNWVVGGGIIIKQLLDLNIIDEMIITIMPVILGQGIPLFVNGNTILTTLFDLTNVHSENNIVELTYQKKKL